MKATSAILLTSFLALLIYASPSAAQVALTSDTHGDPLYGTRFTEDGNRIWFSAISFGYGSELWITDGTAGGTFVAGETIAGTDGEEVEELIVVNNKAFYLINGEEDWELWMSNGTQQGTTRLLEHATPAFADSNPVVNGLAEVNDLVIAFDDEHLLAIDPASGDTSRLRPASGELLVQAADVVYAFMYNPSTFAVEVVRTNGSKAGTEVLSNVIFEDEDQIGVIGNNLIYVADDFSGNGEELYVSDGTVAGSGFLPETGEGDIDIACSEMLPGDGVVYMGIRTSTSSNCTPYQSDGTAAGTVPIVDFSGLLVHGVQEVGNYIYFWEAATELWRTDGTVDGTILLANMQGTSSKVTEFDGLGWFAGYVDGNYALWQTDGTVDGTVEVFRNAIGPVDPLSITVIGDRLYFSAFSTYYIERTNTSTEFVDAPGAAFELDVFPNPFKRDVTVRINKLPLTNQVTISVYDLLGREVRASGTADPSDVEPRLDLSGVPAGVYFVRVESGDRAVTQKVVKL